MHKDDDQAKYEERLQRRLKILKEQIDAGKIHIAPGLRVIDSLKAVRYASDGSIDLDTVDGLVRSMALMAESEHDREELKGQFPLKDIQQNYFTFLQNNFGEWYKLMIEHQQSPHSVALALSRDKDVVAQTNRDLQEFLSTIKEYWESVGDVAQWHIEDLYSGLTAVFGGDLFPTHDSNLASSCGVYTDTIVLPDPYLRSLHLFEQWEPSGRTYYLIKHALNLLQYRELACADISPPMLAVVPDYTLLEDEEREFVQKLGIEDALIHAGLIFGREFSSIDELFEFVSPLDTVDKIVPEIVDPSRVLFDTGWGSDLVANLEQATKDQHAQLLGTNNPGLIIAQQSVGRMSNCNELLIKSRRFRGVPVIQAPTSWQYLVWKLEYDAMRKESATNLTDLHTLQSLQQLSQDEMEWLGAVPLPALLELRKDGSLEEIRTIMSEGIDELTLAEPAGFSSTSDQVFQNLSNAFAKHQQSIEALKTKKWKFAKDEIGSWLVVGSLAITAAATGMPIWGLAALAADQLLEAPKLKDIPSSIKSLAEENQKLERSPVGILFNSSGRA